MPAPREHRLVGHGEGRAVSALLEARGLAVRIGPHQVCAGLDLDLRPGERLGILGRNGAGKTTLLHTLAGLRPAQSGELRLDGQRLEHWSPRQLALKRGLLAQTSGDPFSSTVLEAALVGRHPHLGRWQWESVADAKIATAAIAAVGLAGAEQRETQSLSGGERQRLAIATLLTQAPRLYLLDEPLAHLDLGHQIGVLDLFSERARDDNAAVIMVIHDLDLAARYCDRTLLLFGDGEFRLGDAESCLTAEALTRLFGHPLSEIRHAGRRHFVPA